MGLGYERRPTTPSRPMSSQQQQQWKQGEQLDMKLPPSSLPRSSGFDSLQDLLEREGYKETRIVTPKIPHVITIDDADDMGLVAEDKPKHARSSLKPLHESATNVNLQRSPDKRQDIERWMQGIMSSSQDSVSKSQTKKTKTKPSKTSDVHVLRTSQSDHALNDVHCAGKARFGMRVSRTAIQATPEQTHHQFRSSLSDHRSTRIRQCRQFQRFHLSSRKQHPQQRSPRLLLFHHLSSLSTLRRL